MPSNPEAKVTVPPSPPVSFATDLLPLFRQVDIQHMQSMNVLLSDYSWMSTPANAQSVYDRLSGTATPRMPMGGPYWTPAQLLLFSNWMATGYTP